MNAGLSKASEEVARKGSKDGYEHMYLVNLQNGNLEYYESNGDTGAVGGKKFIEFAYANLDKTFAFIHNHNIESSLSESDLLTPILYSNIPIQIAVQNNGKKYMVKRKKMAPKGFYQDFYYEKQLEELNKKSRSGMITQNERAIERERIIIKELLKEFY